jgi:hypothetical protein
MKPKFNLTSPASRIKIIDIYSGNRINFFNLAAEGYTGVIGKGGQGEWPDLPRVNPNWYKDAEVAGLLWGIYWLVDARHKPSFQVEALKKATNMNWGPLGLWSDIEKPMISMKDRDYNKLPYAGWRGVNDWMLAVQRIGASQFADHLPGSYTSPGAFDLILADAPASMLEFFAKSPLWTAQYYWLYLFGISAPSKYGKWMESNLHWWQVKESPDVNYWMQTDEKYNATYPLFTLPPVDDGAGSGREAYVTLSASRGLWVRKGPGKNYDLAAHDPLYPSDVVRIVEVAEPTGPLGDRWGKIASEQWAAMRYSNTEYMLWR